VAIDISGKKKIKQGQQNNLHYPEQNENIPRCTRISFHTSSISHLTNEEKSREAGEEMRQEKNTLVSIFS